MRFGRTEFQLIFIFAAGIKGVITSTSTTTPLTTKCNGVYISLKKSRTVAGKSYDWGKRF